MSHDGQRTPEEIRQLLGLIKSDQSNMVILPTQEQRESTRVTNAVTFAARETLARGYYQPPLTMVSPKSYAKAQRLLKKRPDEPLTEADLWRAAEIECEQTGTTLVEVYNQVMRGTVRRDP